eukprot:6934935-Karenia_brevis.AAC.1
MEVDAAQEMVDKARSLSKPGVEVTAPRVAVETVDRSAKSKPSSSKHNPWHPSRTYNPELGRPP